MARLLDWIPGLAIVAREPLTGPRAVGGAANESITGYVQTTASAFGAWRWQFTLRGMRGELFRRFRGLAVALHGGANAVRVPVCDPDMMSWAESGVDATPAEIRAGVPWSNGASWQDGENWGVGRPWVAIATAAAKGDTLITLANEYWGPDLDIGDQIGFVPFHFGLYTVTGLTEVTRQYRIWPPLRMALTVDDFATLTPVMAMRLESEAGARVPRGLSTSQGATLTMVEVEDAIVRSHFTEA